MKKQDIVSILITFVIGFLFGGYFYLTNFAVVVSKIETPDVEAISEFVIEATVYGGCRNTCPSFQIQNDGSYHYLYTPAAGVEKVVRKGAVPTEMMRLLRKVMNTEMLRAQSVAIESAVCNSYTDGIDVRYKVTLDGVEYTLDSCGTAVDSDSLTWKALQGVWTYFESGEK